MYEKKTWQTGEVITANALNNLENGVNAALTTFKINVTYNWQTNEATCNKTSAQIKEAYENNYTLVIGDLIQINGESQDTYTVNFPLNEYSPEDVEQGWDASFGFYGFCFSNFTGTVREFIIGINGDESTSINVDVYDLNSYHPAHIDFDLDNNYQYHLHGIYRDDRIEITLEEYLDGEFSQYTATVAGTDFSRKLVVVEPTSFLDFRLNQLDQAEGRSLELTNIVINNDGTVSQYTVYTASSPE